MNTMLIVAMIVCIGAVLIGLAVAIPFAVVCAYRQMKKENL
jgi:hypothetical protein